MNLEVRRITLTDQATLGELYLDGKFECYTLEDRVREGEPKVQDQTAIPAGTYPWAITMSHRFQMNLPLLANVPGFTGIRIHAGNTAVDTKGCILVGRVIVGDSQVALSQVALKSLLGKLGTAHGLIQVG